MKKTKPRQITAVAGRFGIQAKYLEPCGDYKAKVSLDILRKLKARNKAKYIVVTGMTPTQFGEGKTVTTIGLSMAFAKLGKKACACIRQPSLGPLFGVKGGGLGGGRSQVIPAEELSLHFTGDIHAASTAHNLAAAFLDNHLFRGNRLEIDMRKIFWHRVLDVNDRALRSVRIGLGGGDAGVERDTRFDITAASEVMAILALAESYADLRKRLGRIVVALTRAGKAVTCEDLKAAGAMAALLKDALKPNLVQTSENTPCLVHTGPFANITHGNSSILADRMALGLADFVVTESGFGADCGLEKFVDIKCRQSALKPDAAVLVCSVRALKVHSGMFRTAVGKPLDKNLTRENLDAVEGGAANLEKQIDNVRLFGIPCVVVVNRFDTDTDREIAAVKRMALHSGAFDCVISDIYRYGSRGGIEIAKAVTAACRAKGRFGFLYPLEAPIKEKIETIARKLYGAKSVHYEHAAEENINFFNRLGFAKLPVCMAKTHLSLSHDPKLKGAPKEFVLPIRDVRPSVGAGFLYVLCGNVMTMPGLPSNPVGELIDVDPKGEMRYVH